MDCCFLCDGSDRFSGFVLDRGRGGGVPPLNEDSSSVSAAGSASSEALQPEESSEISDSVKVEESVINITDVQKFDNGYFTVIYNEDGVDEPKEGYMSIDGVITTEEPKGLYQYHPAIFYDENGQETFNSVDSGADIMVCDAAYGVYMVQEMRSGLDQPMTYYAGLMDAKGNWLDGPFEVFLTGYTSHGGLGEGILGAISPRDNQNYNLLLFDSETGSYVSVPDASLGTGSQFRNGTIILEVDGNICSVAKDGTVTKLPAEGDLICEGDNGFVTDANTLSFYDRSGQLLWSFDKYELYDPYGAGYYAPYMCEDCVIIHILGADNNVYIGCLSQQTGELVYEPLHPDGYGLISYEYGHITLTSMDGKVLFVDLLTGETVSAPEMDIDLRSGDDTVEYWEDGLYVVRHSEADDASAQYKYYFFDPQGQEVIPTLKTE